MELDEFEVGDATAGAPGHRNAIAGCGVRVGGVEVGLAGAAAGDDSVRGAEGQHLVVVDIQHISAPATLGFEAELCARDQVDDDMAFQHFDVGMLPHFPAQGLLYRSAGGVGDMDDATGAVAAFAGEVVAAVSIVIVAGKGHALFDQPVDGFTAMFDDKTRGDGITESGAGGKGVLNMGFDRVGVVEHGGNATLRPVGGRVVDQALGDQGDPMGVGHAQGEGLPGQAAADDDDVDAAQIICFGLFFDHVGFDYITRDGELIPVFRVTCTSVARCE